MILTGKAFWAMVVGEPRPNKLRANALQWSFDLSIDEAEQKKLLDAGMKKTYLKNKDDERGVFLSFTRDAVKKDGSPGKPFNIVDAQKNPWPKDKLIGNESVLNVIVQLNERTWQKETFLKPGAIAIQVVEHKEYVPGSGFQSYAATEGEEVTKEW